MGVNAARDEKLAEYLQAHDAHCPKCLYELRGLKHATCPECGATISLDLVIRSENRTLEGHRAIMGGVCMCMSMIGVPILVAQLTMWIGALPTSGTNPLRWVLQGLWVALGAAICCGMWVVYAKSGRAQRRGWETAGGEVAAERIAQKYVRATLLLTMASGAHAVISIV